MSAPAVFPQDELPALQPGWGLSHSVDSCECFKQRDVGLTISGRGQQAAG